MGTFCLTDFRVRQFDTIVWKGRGLDRPPELRDMYFGNCDRGVYLAQTDDAKLDRAAVRAVERLGLAYRRRLPGYGRFATFLQGAGTA